MRLNARLSALLAGALAIAAVAGVGYAIYQHHAQTVRQAARARYEASVKANTPPTTRAERCVITVSDKLAQVPDALAQGYSGVDANDLMVQYGATSPEFTTFEQAQGQMIGDIEMYGASGSLQRVMPTVRESCNQAPLTPPN